MRGELLLGRGQLYGILWYILELANMTTFKLASVSLLVCTVGRVLARDPPVHMSVGHPILILDTLKFQNLLF